MQYPPTFDSYNRGAIAAESAHFRLFAIQLILTSSAAVLAVLPIFGIAKTPVILWAVAGLFAIGVLLTYFGSSRQLEQKWFSMRAIRESLKSLTWRFALRVGEFSGDDTAALKTFLERTQGIVGTFSSYRPPHTDSTALDDTAALSELTRIRNLPWNVVRDLYVKDRLARQIDWYSQKATDNERHANLLEYVILGLGILGFVVGIVFVALGLVAGLPVFALLATLIAAILAWGQARRYSGLVGPYRNAESELRRIATELQLTATAESFRSLIEEAERAISREHSMWLAQRGLQHPMRV
ncbi:MAG: DUF4231 domain-containing protein [Thermoplasmata archaeon]|jgi:conflict system pore-forming effector with SLATT domain